MGEMQSKEASGTSKTLKVQCLVINDLDPYLHVFVDVFINN